MITIKRITSPAELASLHQAWNELLERSDVATIFQTHAWILAWWNAFGSEHELFVLLAYDNDVLTGIAPLMSTLSPRPWRDSRTIRFIGTPNVDYADFIGPNKRQLCETILDYFSRHRDEWHSIDLSQIPSRSETLPALRNFLGRVSLPVRLNEADVCMAYTHMGHEHDRSQFTLERKRNLRNSIHFFNRLGGMEYKRLSGEAEITPVLSHFFHCHVVRWQHELTSSKFLSDSHRTFYRSLVRELAPEGKLSVCVLTHGRYPVSFLLAYPHGKCTYFYTIANATFHERKSPGILLFHHAVEDFVRTGSTRIDFARGAGSHKLRFINESSRNWQLTVYRSSWAALVHRVYERLKTLGPAKRLGSSHTFQAARASIRRSFDSAGVAGLGKRLLRPLLDHYRKRFPSVLLIRETPTIIANPEIAVERLERDDIEAIADFLGIVHGSPQHRRLEKRFAEEQASFAAKIADHIAALGWAQSSSASSTGEKRTWLSDITTSPVYPEARTFAALLSFMTIHSLQGSSEVLISCSRLDRTRYEALQRIGFR
jgi:CelD/BcsL family acetyltransferase involved in cellulose biosynthesis